MATFRREPISIVSELALDALAALLDGPGDDDVVRAQVELFIALYTTEHDDVGRLDCVRVCDAARKTMFELRGDLAARFVISDRWPNSIA